MNFSWLIKAESYKRGTALSVLFNILSKGILFILTIIIARYFGSDIKTDIYFFVFGTMLLFSGFINAIDAAVLIPESMRLRESEGNDRAAAFLNFFLVVYGVIGIVFSVVMYFFGTTVFGLISKFSENDILIYRDYFRAGSLFFIFHLLTNYINTILTSLKYFSIPMIISSIKSAIAIACIFLLEADYDVLAVFLGGLIAYAFNLVLLLFILSKMAGWKFNVQRLSIKKRVWSNIFYSELGQLATVASSLFPLYLLSGFGSGILSVMNYGKNIADIPNTLITAQFTNVSGIKLNEQSARGDHAGVNDTFVRTSKLLVFILVPLGCFMFVFAEPIVLLFYKTGNFTQAAIKDSARFLQLFSISVFCIGINAMVTRIFIAMQAIRQAFLYQVILNILLIAAIWIFTKKYGAYGYPYGIILVNMINFISMYFVCRKLFRNIEYGRLLKYSAWVLAINLPVAVVLFYLLSTAGLIPLYKLFFGFCIYLVVFLGMSRIKKASFYT